MATARFTLPMTPAGGAFLACVGAALLAYALAPHAMRTILVVVMLAAAVPALIGVAVLSAKRGLRRPRRLQFLVLYPTIAVEFLAIWLLVPHLHSERMIWIAVLGIVGLHFLPMYWTHGVRMAALGVACMAVALAGWLMPGLPLVAVIAADGALKLVFGLWMLSALPGRPVAAG